MKKKIVAIIPVRKGSKRIKNKNFKNFAGSNLFEIKLKSLKKINLIDKIVVSTDSEIAIKIAKKYNVSYQRREKYYASSKCTNSEFFENLAKSTEGDFLMYTPCTAPLIQSSTIEKFLKKFILSYPKFDSMNTINYVKEHLWLNNRPLNYNPKNSPNTQDLPNIMKLTYGINIISKKKMIEKKNVLGNKPFFFKIDEIEGIDVDNPIDFEIAEFLYKKKFKKR
jgi:CMP-N-acetylneuraminic acid synthetase